MSFVLTARRFPAALARSRRAFLVTGALAIAGLLLPQPDASAQQEQDARHWVGTWGAAPAGPPLPAQVQTFTNQTLRLIAHVSIGGRQVRIRLSNEFGTVPLQIRSAHIALRESGASIVPGTDRVLTFGGSGLLTIPAGATAMSDAVSLDVPALSDVAISLHLPGTVQASTMHDLGVQTNYISPPGDFAGAKDLPVQRTIVSWPFLTEVDVVAPGGASIVTLGDSITDASRTQLDANHRWPDLLAKRLQAASSSQPGLARLGVVNRGLSGNRLLRDPGEFPLFGKAALARFERDVLSVPGVRYMTLLIGVNDIGQPGRGAIPISEVPTAEEMIAGYRQIIAQVHRKGILIFGATITPYEGTIFTGYHDLRKEAIRQAVNDWIRNGGEFDGVLDFDRALRDPKFPNRLLPAYDSGDHLHPNDQGMQAMADAVPLEIFSASQK
jgi:lysophospholipase L1-like esterase